ncbi:hypothetical protein EP7_003120 [Isosphaeraceae bacterium EP7]
MPPAPNESQGLKIAVAAFVSLTVILAVTSYFLYSSYDQASVKQIAAERKASESDNKASLAVQEANFLKTQAGYSSIEDFEQAKAAMKKDQDAIAASIRDAAKEVNEAIAKSKAAGLNDPKFEELTASIQGLATQYESDPNKTYKDSLIRLKDLLLNQARLATNLSLNDLELRTRLENSAQVSSARLAEETTGFNKSKDDLQKEHEQHEKERADLNAKVDEYQTRIATLSSELSNLKAQSDQAIEALNKKYSQLQGVNRNLQELADKNDSRLDKADARVTFVDPGRGEVRVNLNRAMGAKPQMEFSVFDKDAAGIPTDKPKGIIQILSVGETDSVARVVKTMSLSDPIREKDLVYSAAWSANDPQQFALIGNIDINRDGRDDRADLIRLIESAGGVVVYDLPPPSGDRIPGERAVNRYYTTNHLGVPPKEGRGVGEITSRLYAYVIDERDPYFDKQKSSYVPSKADQDFVKELSDARRVARDNGVRPMPIERLLTYMGYSTFTSLPRAKGETEYINKAAVKQLLRDKGGRTPAEPAEGEPTTAPAPAPAPEAEGDQPK